MFDDDEDFCTCQLLELGGCALNRKTDAEDRENKLLIKIHVCNQSIEIL